MSDSNRAQLTGVREVTLGTTPNTPRMRKVRHLSAPLIYKPEFETSNEKREDRMGTDPVKVGESNNGPINFEFSYPEQDALIDTFICSSMQADWVNTPSRFNDGVADSVITGVVASTGVVSVTTGAAFVLGHLCKLTGFTAAGNNTLKKITTGSPTVPAFGAGAGLADEAVPPAAARMKVVGFEGASGDITALADGLGSTALDFTTLGLTVGGFVKIGGTGAAFQFATAACNDWARVIAVAATTDAGAAKTIRVFFGDLIKNGVTKIGATLERAFLDQTVPTYIAQRGMVVNEANWSIETKKIINGSFAFIGMGGAQSTVGLDAVPDAASAIADFPVMAAGANVGRIAESGVKITGNNFVKNLSLKITNNIRDLTDVENLGPVDLGSGRCDVSVNLSTYFGSNTFLTKLFAGTAVNINARVLKANRAVVWSVPRLTYTDGAPDDSGINADIMLSLTAQASFDTLTNAHILMNRLEYYE